MRPAQTVNNAGNSAVLRNQQAFYTASPVATKKSYHYKSMRIITSQELQWLEQFMRGKGKNDLADDYKEEEAETQNGIKQLVTDRKNNKIY